MLFFFFFFFLVLVNDNTMQFKAYLFIILIIFTIACLQPEKNGSTSATHDSTTVESNLKIESLFNVCAGCHGYEGAGGTGIAPPFQNNPWIVNADLEEIITVITNGRNYQNKVYPEYASSMPRWNTTYSEGDIAELARYIKRLA